MPAGKPLPTSTPSNRLLAWRIFRYLVLRSVVLTGRFAWWCVVRSVQFVVGVLALVASPASSGRAHDEFKDLVPTGSPDERAATGAGSDGFWRMYLQAYSPRLWRMRKLLPASAGLLSRKQQPNPKD